MKVFIFFYGDETIKNQMRDKWDKVNQLISPMHEIEFGPSDDDHNFLMSEFEYYKFSFEQKKYTQMSDIWRLYKLFNESGLYMDSYTNVNEEIFLDFLNKISAEKNNIFIKENPYYVNLFFTYVCEKNNYIIGDALDRYRNYKNIQNLYDIELLPLQITYSFKKSNIKIRKFEETKFQNNFFKPLSFVDPSIKENIIYANFQGTWKNKKNDWAKTFSKFQQRKHKNIFVKIYMILWWKFDWILNIILFFLNKQFFRRNISLKK